MSIRVTKIRAWSAGRSAGWSAGMIAAAALGAALATAPVGLSAGHETADSDVESFIASLEGGWSGEDNTTPLGPMPFALLFERHEDGSLRAHSALNRETYVDLRFRRDADSRWLLREEAGMEGLGVQGHDLVPAGKVGEKWRWIHPERPEFLHIDVGVEDSVLSLYVELRGEEHVRFALDRLPEEVLPEMKRQLELQASQSPEEGVSIHEIRAMMAERRAAEHETAVAGRPDATDAANAAGASDDAAEASDPVATARRGRDLHPDRAEAHLDLAKALGAAIQENPANGPLYAYEMLDSLELAIELDRELAEAYHWLVGYYLNAPPIAGGSVEKAEATARTLAEFDPQGAEGLLSQIAARRATED